MALFISRAAYGVLRVNWAIGHALRVSAMYFWLLCILLVLTDSSDLPYHKKDSKQ